MSKQMVSVMLGAASVVVFIGLIIFLWSEGLSRATEWSNVFALFVALGMATGSVTIWSLNRRRQESSPSRKSELQNLPPSVIEVKAKNVNNQFNGGRNKVRRINITNNYGDER